MRKSKLFKSISLILIFSIILTGCDTNSEETKKISTEIKSVLINDAKGEVEIPEFPERIVDLSGNSDILSILGYKVIGTANSDAYDYKRFPKYLEETLDGATILGYSMQDTMDVEAIINLEPDLIIISAVQEKMYAQLQEIAPTVMIKLNAFNWKADVTTFAKIFNKEAIANKWLEDYESKAISYSKKIKAINGENTSYLSFLASAGQFYVFDGAGFGSLLYEDMKLKKPEGMPIQEDISLPVVTYEGLAKINADHIFLISSKEDIDLLEKNAIWKNLPAVKNGNITKLSASPYFIQGYSSIGREQLLDEILEMLS